MFDTEENPFITTDEGAESSQPVSGEVDHSPPEDSAVETKPEEPAEKIEGDEGEGEKVSEKEDISDDDRRKLEEEATARLADPRTPKWFKNAVENVYERKVQKAHEELEAYAPIKSYGDLDKVKSDLETYNGLNATRVNPTTNLPEPTVAPFVEKLLSESPQKVELLFKEIASLPMPDNSGLTVLQGVIKSIGIDPTRLAEIKKFAENGYQSVGGQVAPAELSAIPENLREAYIAASPAERDRMMPYEGESDEEIAAREAWLGDKQYRLNTEREKNQAEEQRLEQAKNVEIAQKQQFQREWESETATTTFQSDESITSSFIASLTDPAVGFDESEAIGLGLTISAALDGESALGKKALAVLESKGISLNPELGTLFDRRNEAAKYTAFYKQSKNEAEYQKSAKELKNIEAAIENAAKPITAHLAKSTADGKKAKSERQSGIVEQATKKFNTGIKTGEGEASIIGTGATASTKGFSQADYDSLGDPFAR